jgi:hypothetical protein
MLNASMGASDLALMKERVVLANEAPKQTRGSHNDLRTHTDALIREFSGQPELALHHATLIVLIRRESSLEKNVDSFSRLWQSEHPWLIQNLNIRWLVSAADTFADHAEDPIDRALALSVSLLANTVKAYETERYLCNVPEAAYSQDRVAHVQEHLVPIFEGISCYTVGSDDTLRNMVWRIQTVSKDRVVGKILLAVLERLAQLPTPYGRMREAHTRKKTEWWTQ